MKRNLNFYVVLSKELEVVVISSSNGTPLSLADCLRFIILPGSAVLTGTAVVPSASFEGANPGD